MNELDIALGAATLEGLIVAVVGGTSLGFLVFGAQRSDDTNEERETSVTPFYSMLLGLVFFAPRVVMAWWTDDDQWPRIIVVLGLWMIFSVCLGAGIILRHRFNQRGAGE